ncbi:MULTISPECIES: hypothetical protein [unclassified Crossiella]|uniref:hypothetical protein n=1 Tax=unclassified Crossiella TaxID=2620835 RepID=UPI001FFEF731|nr:MULTISPECIES: hypothetical protein [unclassified Crossiella]MCK2243394.1 hypothetical protein [Crossiella sp. S99.2]MCK2254137.1 hypothetical protein [Crossiella sp. S99.1]
MFGGRRGIFTRAGLARALAVLGLLIGLVLTQEAAHADDPSTPGCHSLYSVALLVADHCVPGQPGQAAPQHGPDQPADLLGACLALLVAVLLVLAALPGPRTLITVLAQFRAPRPPTGRRRSAPSLAQLCVLRT